MSLIIVTRQLAPVLLLDLTAMKFSQDPLVYIRTFNCHADAAEQQKHPYQLI